MRFEDRDTDTRYGKDGAYAIHQGTNYNFIASKSMITSWPFLELQGTPYPKEEGLCPKAPQWSYLDKCVLLYRKAHSCAKSVPVMII